MKKGLIIIFLISASLLMPSTNILNLNATYSGGLVKIGWQSSIESNVKEYIIEKSSDDVTYTRMTSESPKGSSSTYSVFDLSTHSKETTLFYRIVVLDYDGSRFVSDNVSVKIATAGISATWGSIKAMFR